MFKYFPHTKEDINKMLTDLNISSIDELFCHISENVLLKEDYNIKSEMSELEIREYFKNLNAPTVLAPIMLAIPATG